MKYCTHCGAELLDEAVICPKCGCWTNDNGNVLGVSKPELNKLSLVGFILSIVSAVVMIFSLSIESDSSFFIFSSILVAIVGFVCSLIGLLKLKRNNERGKGLAITGIVVGAIVGLAWILLILLAIFIVVLFYVFLIISLIAA